MKKKKKHCEYCMDLAPLKAEYVRFEDREPRTFIDPGVGQCWYLIFDMGFLDQSAEYRIDYCPICGRELGIIEPEERA